MRESLTVELAIGKINFRKKDILGTQSKCHPYVEPSYLHLEIWGLLSNGTRHIFPVSGFNLSIT